MVLHEFRVVQLFPYEDVQYAERQSPVRAWADRKPEPRLFGQLVRLRVNDDEGNSLAYRVPDVEAQLPVRAGDRGVCAPDKDGAGAGLSVIIHPRKMSGGKLACVFPGSKANERSGACRVRRAENIGKPPELGQVMPSRAGDEGDALRAMLFYERAEPFRHLVQRIIPAYALEFAASPRSLAAKGI